jgi:hypothetical protein
MGMGRVFDMVEMSKKIEKMSQKSGHIQDIFGHTTPSRGQLGTTLDGWQHFLGPFK